MKEKAYLTIIAALLIAVLGCTLKMRSTNTNNKTTTTKVVYKDHYITDFKVDTVYRLGTDTVTLNVHDTVNDTSYIVRPMKVEVPIDQYYYDTTMADSSRFEAFLSGFNVSLDSLHVEYPESVSTTVYEPLRKWHFGFGFALGFGIVK